MEELRRSGGARVAELTEILGVSDMTVRRDLKRLQSLGSLEKVHGGAVLSGTASEEPGFEIKSGLQQAAKGAIAAAAAALIRPGSAIAVSAGTTTWGLAGHISAIPGLAIVTNSTTVADLIAHSDDRADRTVILTGGVRTPSAALVGPVADLALRSLHVDQLFLGVHGMEATKGFTTPNLAEAETNRAMIACANQVIVCADATKWGAVGLASFATLSAADILITDDALSAEAHAVLSDRVGTLIVVSADQSSRAHSS